ncbi:MAG: DUF1508 domain-containing protein [Bacteroidetes bacterium]|nr:DUF1508 domain-containing protein [Bacteroidota bacterium]
MVRFIINKSKEGTFEYSLVETDGEAILSSQGYGSKQGCKIGISSVKSNASADVQYERKKGRNGKTSFNLLSHNGRVIGEGGKFASEASMEKVIAFLKKKAKSAKIVDETRQRKRSSR